MFLAIVLVFFMGLHISASHISASQHSNAIILVLGCHMNEILEDRMSTALQFAKDLDKPVTWFLSGGTKNQIDGMIQQTEANDMAYFVSNSNSKWQIKLDTQATNTAENFAYFRKWIDDTMYDADIYVVTSEFHHNRASSIMAGIIQNPVEWVLGTKSCTWCDREEGIHIRNVRNDIEKALDVYSKL